MQYILMYFLASGIYSYYRVQPSTLERDLNKWCEKHKDDEDFVQQKQLHISQIELIGRNQWVTDLTALLLGWFIVAGTIIETICEMTGIRTNE